MRETDPPTPDHAIRGPMALSRDLPSLAWLLRGASAVRLPVDGFVLGLIGVVLAASVVPCRGDSAIGFHAAGIAAIAALFFLQGARLSSEAIVRGITHWRLHAVIAATTFVLFPLFGLGLHLAFPHLLSRPLLLGVLFLCALPSTVQSSIALTSIANGNVPGAICSATMSNIAGIVIAPLLFGAMSNSLGSDTPGPHPHAGEIDVFGVWKVVVQLLVPFAAGHLSRPWIGTWAERNRAVLSVTDRSSILLVVYGAFSAAVVRGIWHQIPMSVLAVLASLMALLLGCVLMVTRLNSRTLGFDRADEAAAIFCGAQKSLITGVPIANAMVSGAAVGPLLLPLLFYYPMQLLVCAWLARRYGIPPDRRDAR